MCENIRAPPPPPLGFHPQKYQEFQAPQKYFTRAYVYMKISDTPPPSRGVFLHSCIVIPGAPVSQIKLA